MSIDLYLDTLDQYICFSLEKIPEVCRFNLLL